jgi:hypothetical protein
MVLLPRCLMGIRIGIFLSGVRSTGTRYENEKRYLLTTGQDGFQLILEVANRSQRASVQNPFALCLEKFG